MRNRKKLVLSQETLRNLTQDELTQVAAAGNSHSCVSICAACPTTTVQITCACQ